MSRILDPLRVDGPHVMADEELLDREAILDLLPAAQVRYQEARRRRRELIRRARGLGISDAEISRVMGTHRSLPAQLVQRGEGSTAT
jgi:hypothetical protein